MNEISLFSSLFDDSTQPRIEIVLQPSPIYRMRYQKDTRRTNLFADDGQNDPDSEIDDTEESESSERQSNPKPRKQPPKVKVHNLQGTAALVVCCVSSEHPYHVHPNSLVGHNCQDGYAKYIVDPTNNVVELRGIRIQLIRKNDLKDRIDRLKELNIDPFGNSFDDDSISKLDLGKLKLCFQLYELNNQTKRIEFHAFNPNIPVLSNTISTSMQKLNIIIQQKCNLIGPACGGTEVVLFVKKLEKEQKPIHAKFFDNTGWSVDVLIDKIHYRNSMIFKSPPYKEQFINENVVVNLKLYVPFSERQDDSVASYVSSKELYESEIIKFEYTPNTFF